MRLFVLAGAVVLAALPFSAFSQESTPAALPPEIPMSRLVPDAVVPARLEPGSAVAADGVWTRDGAAGTLVRIDAKSNAPGNITPAGPQPCASIAEAFGSLWTPVCGSGAIVRVKPGNSTPDASLPLKVADEWGSIASGVGSVWAVTDREGVVSRIDPGTNQVVAEMYVAAGASHVAFDKDAVFVTSGDAALLTRINAHTNVIDDTVKVGPRPGPMAIGEDAVWVLNRGDRSVTRVDRKSGKAVVTITTGAGAGEGDIAAGEGGIWVSVERMPIIRIDPRTNRVTHRFSGDGGGAVRVAHGSVWVAAGPKLTWRLDPALLAALRP